MRHGRSGILLGAALMLVTAVGCGPNAQQKELNDLRAERDKLQGDLNAQKDLLNECSNREAAARNQLDDLRRQLAAAQNKPPTIIEKTVPGPAGAPAGGWTSMPGFDMISIAGEVLFDSGKNTLRPAGKTALDKIASDIKGKYADRDIYVFGHTDNDPIKKSGWKDNWELGAQRALTVCRYLIGAGVPSKSIIQASAGDQRPRGSNSTAAGKQQNRRVEFYAVIKRGGASTTPPSGAGE